MKVNKKPLEALVVLGGGLIKDRRGWRLTDFKDIGLKGNVGGEYLNVIAASRVTAASWLQRRRPAMLVIASGGKGYLRQREDAPTVASVVRKELIKLGVKPSLIIQEARSHNTYQQLVELLPLIKKHKFSKTTLISNRYHLPRIKAFLKFSPGLAGYHKIKSLKLLAAEQVLVTERDKQVWRPLISRAYRAPLMKQRLKLERQGIKDIKQGSYKYFQDYDYKNRKTQSRRQLSSLYRG